MSITKEFYVELDLKHATGNRDFTLVEGDTGNIIHVTLCDDGTPVDLTDCRVLAVFTKPTGSSMQDSAIADGGVTVGGADGNEVTIDLFAASFGVGTNACELQIYSGAERDVLVTSAAFNFYCRNGIIDDDTIRSTDEYPLLTSLIRQVQAIDDSVLTPSDVDAGLSAASENPVQNKAVKEALDGKAAFTHTHRKADVTDFSHAHTASEITDFAHTHGNLTNDGKLGTTENLPVFTGTGGAVGVKTASDARDAIGAMSWTLLWENASTTSAFPSQTLSLTLSGYSALLMVLHDKANQSSQLSQIIPISGASKLIAYESTATANWYSQLYSRVVTVTATSVVFDSGYYSTETKPKAQNDSMIIPVRIYGIKGVS